MDLSYRLGYRAIKTAISVFVCLLLGYLLNRTAAFAVIAAILCIQPTYDKSKHTGLHRILGTILGSLFSFVPLELATIIPQSAEYLFLLILPGMILLLIFVCNILGIKDSVGPSCVIFMAIVLLHAGTTLDTLPYVLTRTAETVAGVLVALPINRFLFNPRELTSCGSDDK